MKKQFTIRRFLALFSALALCLSLSVSAFAAGVESRKITDDGTIIESYTPGTTFPMPRASYYYTLIDEPYMSGIKKYTNTTDWVFTTDRGEDGQLNIQNTGNCDINASFTFNGVTFSRTLKPDENWPNSFHKDGGLSGTGSITVTAVGSGNYMSLSVYLVQILTK